ncbi:MAG TPA: hypothetical protein VK427_20290 [Kofleriaceae bacterium]|nr:hypothetical protein [Kofleriaceae bacterium]
MRAALAIAVLACACDRAPPIASCTDDLAGVYEAETAPTRARWHVLDNRVSLEVYPIFADSLRPDGLEVAPRVIDLRRTPDAFVGQVTRRYMRGTTRCDAKAPARVTTCKDNTLEIVLADPVPPIGFAPCVWGQTASSRRERWRRVQ